MPTYPWLHRSKIDPEDIRASVVALKRAGTPYTDADVSGVPAQLAAQGQAIVGRLKQAGITAEPDDEIVALIAYLQRLGVDGRAAIAAGATRPTTAPPATASAPADGRETP
jgi:cytochrome c oxidase cbb3-type subunit I/II